MGFLIFQPYFQAHNPLGALGVLAVKSQEKYLPIVLALKGRNSKDDGSRYLPIPANPLVLRYSRPFPRQGTFPDSPSWHGPSRR